MEPSNEYKNHFRRTFGQYDQDGFDVYGYDAEGYDRRGFNWHGYDRGNRHISRPETGEERLRRLWTAKYENSGGYNEDGYNIHGLNEHGWSKANYMLEEQRKEREQLERQQRELDAVLAKEYEISSTPVGMNVNKMARGSSRKNRGHSKGVGVRNNAAATNVQRIELQFGNRQGPDGDWYRQGMNGMWYDLNDGGISYYSVWPESRNTHSVREHSVSRRSVSPGKAATRKSHGRGVGVTGSPDSNDGSPGRAMTRNSRGKGPGGKGLMGKGTGGKGLMGKGPSGKGLMGKGALGKGSRKGM